MAISVRDIQERARSTHRFTTRTGEAERSIEAEVTGSGTSLQGTVGTTRLITIYLHQGTRPTTSSPGARRCSGGHQAASLYLLRGPIILASRRTRSSSMQQMPKLIISALVLMLR